MATIDCFNFSSLKSPWYSSLRNLKIPPFFGQEEFEKERKAVEEELKRKKRLDKEREVEQRRKQEEEREANWLNEKEATRKRKEEAAKQLKILEAEGRLQAGKVLIFNSLIANQSD